MEPHNQDNVDDKILNSPGVLSRIIPKIKLAQINSDLQHKVYNKFILPYRQIQYLKTIRYYRQRGFTTGKRVLPLVGVGALPWYSGVIDPKCVTHLHLIWCLRERICLRVNL